MTASRASALTPEQRRQVLYVLIPTLAIAATAFAIAHNARGELAMWMDNVHWTIAYLGGSTLAWMGVRWADSKTAPARRWFAYGITCCLFGQILWNVLDWLHWAPFPAPPDAFFWSMGPCCTYGMWLSYRNHRQQQRNRGMVLDTVSFAVVALTAIMAAYLPQRGVATPFELTMLIAYPVSMLTATCIGIIMIPTLQLRFNWNWFTLFAVLAINGALWMIWNNDVLSASIADGAWLNFGFSLVGIGIGLGTVLWQLESSADARWARYCENLLCMLPLVLTCVATLGVGLVWTWPQVPHVVTLSVTSGAAVMCALAIVRQSVLLYEREQLIAVENRAGEMEQTFHALFYATRDGLAIIDQTGRLLEVNPAASQIFGYQRNELLGMNLAQLIWSQAGAAIQSQEAARLLLADSCRDLCGGTFTHRSGELMHLEVSSVPVPNSNAHVIVEFRDITARKAAEAAHAHLEAQLRQSQKLEAIGTLASGIAHDFNNILSVIAGNIDLAEMEINRPQALQLCLQQARKAVHRARDLISRIVAFARPQETARQTLQLSDVVDDALKLLRATLPSTVHIRSDLPAHLPLVSIDSSQIFQVLLNLCTNACHAMVKQRGEIAVLLQACEVTADSMSPSGIKAGLHVGRYVQLRVTDNGSGIDPLVAERIFEPFFTTKPVGQGSGLGLSMVHSIVRAHGGAITVDSTPGHGTAFSIHLPASTAREHTAAPAVIAPPADNGKGQHILCVDDEEALVFLLSRVLERRGYRVSGYTQPQLALTTLRSGEPNFDLIITDLSMPGMSGVDFAREALRLQPQVPIVLVSGYIEKHEIDAARAVGIKDVLLKPDSVDDLAGTIHRLLSAQAALA